jgi:cytochrome c-type biogenesis protein CcmF
MDTQFIGEHLVPGQLGHFFIITSFVAALFSTFSYLSAVRKEQSNPYSSRIWQLLGRNGFILHFASIIGIFYCLYYVIANHLFEYHYAWEHSSRAMPKEFLLSCFWEGQEGSFMLWTFWHCVLGLVVMRTSKILETRVMTIISFVQVFLTTMLLGIYLGPDIKVGSTPFLLLRQAMQGAPIFAQANYMNFVQDGNGLNVLLQNYWMVIHPPVLFLGFASTLIPFAYCIAAIWKGDYESFVRPTITWSLFGGAVLGTGIMMGGAWAYESLNFGGYWAWDPVENASLVPWLVLIGGLHTLLVYKSTKRSLVITFILLILAHLLIWYSTFLTRTGILGKTSVHAFTGDGKALTYHLIIVIGLLLILSIALLVWRWKQMPRVKSEEETWTREFWMFIGSIVLLLSSIQIAITTSIPVWSPLYKWITGKDVAPPVNVMQHYNSIQVWIAVIIGLLSAVVMYMKYKKGDAKSFGKRLLITAGIALIITLAIGFGQHINAWQYDLMLFAACYGIVANLWYTFAVQKGRLKHIGPPIAHFGFAMVLLGILLSSFNKHVISFNTLGEILPMGKKTPEEDAKESRENQLLFHNSPVAMGDYQVTYTGDSSVAGKDMRIYYKVNFKKVDSATHDVKESFFLYPDAFINPKGEQGLSANPSTKHYWDRDIFTFINSASDKTKSDTSTYRSHIIHKGDTIFINSGYLVFNQFNTNVKPERYAPQQGDIAVAAEMTAYDLHGKVKDIAPIYYIHNMAEGQVDDTVTTMDVYAKLSKIIPQQDAAEIMIRQTDPKDDFIVLKALVFPFINVLWLGVVIMVLGFFISMVNSVRKSIS